MLTFIFPQPLFITAMSVISFTSLASLGLSELRGKHLLYSKFWNSGSKTSAAKKIKLSSRTGMLIAYIPAFLAGVASFVLYPQENIRILLLCSAQTIHFFKRIFEVRLYPPRFSDFLSMYSSLIFKLEPVASIYYLFRPTSDFAY